jgi:hypothetical protein
MGEIPEAKRPQGTGCRLAGILLQDPLPWKRAAETQAMLSGDGEGRRHVQGRTAEGSAGRAVWRLMEIVEQKRVEGAVCHWGHKVQVAVCRLGHMGWGWCAIWNIGYDLARWTLGRCSKNCRSSGGSGGRDVDQTYS